MKKSFFQLLEFSRFSEAEKDLVQKLESQLNEEAPETKYGLTVGKAYVQNIKGSRSLLFVYSFSRVNGYVNCYGLNHIGEWSDDTMLFKIEESFFIEAEQTYIDKRLAEYDNLLKNKALYGASGKDVKFVEGGFYAGVRGRKTFFVRKDNKDLTYDIVTLDKNGKEVLRTIYFDKTARLLTMSQAGAYLKKIAVKRGFTRRDLSFCIDSAKDIVLLGFNDSLIWFNGFWNTRVISREEAYELFENKYIIG